MRAAYQRQFAGQDRIHSCDPETRTSVFVPRRACVAACRRLCGRPVPSAGSALMRDGGVPRAVHGADLYHRNHVASVPVPALRPNGNALGDICFDL